MTNDGDNLAARLKRYWLAETLATLCFVGIASRIASHDTQAAPRARTEAPRPPAADEPDSPCGGYALTGADWLQTGAKPETELPEQGAGELSRERELSDNWRGIPIAIEGR